MWYNNCKLYGWGFLFNVLGLLLRLVGIVAGSSEAGRWNIFHDFDGVVVLVVVSGSFSGIMAGCLMKFADNVVIVFADSLSLLISIVLSYVFFELEFGFLFIAGVTLVIGSTYLYHFAVGITKAFHYKSLKQDTGDDVL